MRQKAVFHHAGCPACLDAEQHLADALDPARFEVEIVQLGDQRDRLDEARAAGVQSVPALVMRGLPLHINFGAALADRV